VPKELLSLAGRLEALSLKNNKLRSLPEWIGKFKQLKQLDVQGNLLVVLPLGVADMDSLEIIKISGNNFGPDVRDILDVLVNEKRKLELKKGIPKLSQSIGILRTLKTLMLPGTGITHLPKEIGYLRHLELLDVHDNKLKDLPDNIGQLVKLQILDVDKNRLSTLPPSITELKMLRELSLSHNDFSKFPLEIIAFGRLEMLQLAHNKLRVIPPQIALLRRLVSVSFAHNKLAKLPIELTLLPRLRRLYLNSNLLTTLPQEIKNLGDLKELHLNNNQLKYIYHDIGGLGRLQGLHLENNDLVEITSTLGYTTTLKCLKLSGNAKLRSPTLDVVKKGLQPTLEWLRSRAEKKFAPSYQMKLLFLGHEGAGKSAVKYYLKKNKHAVAGIGFGKHKAPLEVDDWIVKVKMAKGDQEWKIHFTTWDFVGKPEVTRFMPIFFGGRVLYVVVWNAKEYAKHGVSGLEYWVQLIHSRTINANIIISVTHRDVVSEAEMKKILLEIRAKFMEQITGVEAVSAKDGTGMAELRQLISKKCVKNKVFQENFPFKYFQLRKILSHLEDPLLSWKDFKKIGNECGITHDPQLRRAMTFLSEKGIIIDMPPPTQLVILDPTWLSRILTKVHKVNKEGVLVAPPTMDQFWRRRHWNFGADDLVRQILHQLMLSTSLTDDHDLFPAFLPKLDATRKEEEEHNTKSWLKFANLHVLLRFRRIPNGFFARLMVDMFRCGEVREYWRTGFIVEMKGEAYAVGRGQYCSARVELLEGDRLRILFKFKDRWARQRLEDLIMESLARVGYYFGGTFSIESFPQHIPVQPAESEDRPTVTLPIPIVKQRIGLGENYVFCAGWSRWILAKRVMSDDADSIQPLKTYSQGSMENLVKYADYPDSAVFQATIGTELVLVRVLKKDIFSKVKKLPFFQGIFGHPNVLSFVGVSVTEHALIAPDITDKSLRTVISLKGKNFTKIVQIKVAIGICEALYALHYAEPRIIPQNISSQNIKVAFVQRSIVQASVLAYGLDGPNLTFNDTRADNIFQLGSVLYEIFAKADPLADDDYASDLDFPKGIPKSIVKIIKQCRDKGESRPKLIEILKVLYKEAKLASQHLYHILQDELDYASTDFIIERLGTAPLRRYLQDGAKRRQFLEFLKGEHSSENLEFYDAAAKYRSDPTAAAAQHILNKFFYSETVNCSADIKAKITSRVKRRDYPPSLFDEAQKSIYVLMETDSFVRFAKSQKS